MKNIILAYYRETFYCSSFTQKYDSISFINTALLTEVSFIQNCDCSNTIVNCTNKHEGIKNKHGHIYRYQFFCTYAN